MFISSFKVVITASSLCFLLSGCGGGGGGGGNSNPSSIARSSAGTSTSISSNASSSAAGVTSSMVSSMNSSVSSSAQATVRRIPVGVKARLTPDLFLIDTVNLQSSFTVESNLQNGFFTLPLGDYNPATKVLSNVRPGHVAYIKSGKIYKVNLESASKPVPQQLSSETQAADECPDPDNNGVKLPNVIVGTPSLDGAGTVLFYKALVAGSCVDRAVKFSMSAVDTPYNLGNVKILTPFVNPTTGVIAGFFATQGNAIGTVDTSLTNFSSLANFTNAAFVANASQNSALLNIDGAIRRFDFSTKQLSSVIITFPQTSTIVGLPDNTAYYFSGPQVNASGVATGNTSLYKITDSSTPLVSTLYTSNQTNMFLQALTPTKAVIFETSGYSTVAKTGGSTTNLNIPAGASAYGSNGERIFYLQASFPSLNLSKFGSLLSNNTNVVDFADTWSFGAYGLALGFYDSSAIDSYIVAEFANGKTNYAKANINLVSGATGQKTALLGTMPDVGYADASTDAFRYGAIEFCSGFEVSGSVCDAYYYSSAAGSLTRLTTNVP